MGANKMVTETCKIGQGHDCCRYLVVGPDGLECAKQNTRAKTTLDLRVELGTIVARGDNCDGFTAAESIIPLNKEDEDE
jgi:hypothetical protein